MLLNKKHSHNISWLLCLTMAVSPCLMSVPVQAGGFRNPFYKQTSMEKLADKIDDLEEHVEKYGTVVAKTPDVWGEARLTKYRRDVENQLEERLTKFDETINASISRSDKAFLANALTLQAAAAGTTPDATSATALVQDNATNVTVDVFKDDTNRTVNIFPSSGGVGKTQIQGISLEPTTGLDQLSRYLKHLNQLRRINDGDDTADAPGYALHLVRIPVSVLPGKKTREGYGAEITITAEPHLGDDLLSNTFRSLAINDVVDQLTFPLTEFLRHDNPEGILETLKEIAAVDAEARALKTKQKDGLTLEEISTLKQAENKTKKLKKDLQDFLRSTQFFKSTTNLSHRSIKPYASSQMFDIYSMNLSAIVANEALSLKGDKSGVGGTLLLDVQKWLIEELESSYSFMESFDNGKLWEHANATLAEAVRNHDISTVRAIRNNVLNTIIESGLTHPDEVGETKTPLHSHVLSWALIVEAALLDQRLKEDIQDVATSKNCNCLPQNEHGMPYSFTPNHHDDPQVQNVFKGYVKCRWPVHVFAIDPITQDQNVADSFSQRRELQLAMSIAFTQGQMNASNFTRFARRLDLDMDSISLNRTTVGFSHGDDTFGWRFYPRVQSPEVESNLSVAFGDLLIGGPSRDKLLRQRRLEPGKRECVALVVMPSFVPYTIFDMRSNWFKLTNPKKKELTLSDTVEISEEIKSLDRLMVCCQEEIGKYRQGEVHRLKRAVKQLERKLPLQTSYVSMPFENSAGGFELLSKGTTALGPQLDGFYGKPGFKKAIEANVKAKTSVESKTATAPPATSTPAPTTTNTPTPEKSAEVEIFLVGDNFSVHETTVIAGNREAKHELLSRRIMKVSIPPNAQANGDHIDVHVATPYGISNHLEIPFIETKSSTTTATEAATKAVKTALTAHAKSHHPTSFSISQSKADLSASIVLLNTKLSEIHFNNPNEFLTISVKDENYSKLFVSTKLDLAFKVTVTGKNRAADGKLTDSKQTASAGIWAVPIVSSTPFPSKDPQYQISLAELTPILQENLKPLAFTGGVESIELVGFVRNTVDQLPITQVQNPVKITVTHNPIVAP